MKTEGIPPGIQMATGCDSFEAAYLWTQGQSIRCVTHNGQIIKVVPVTENKLGNFVTDNQGSLSIYQRQAELNPKTNNVVNQLDGYESFTLIDSSEVKTINMTPAGDVCVDHGTREIYVLTSALAGKTPMGHVEMATKVKQFEESSGSSGIQNSAGSLGFSDTTEIAGDTIWSGYFVSVISSAGQLVATAVNGVSGYFTADKSQV